MRKRIKLIHTIEHGLKSFFNTDENGIFITYWNNHYDSGQQTTDTPLTWLDEEISREIDRMYYLEHSGNKPISITYDRMIYIREVEDNTFDVKGKLMDMIVSKFYDKWNRLYEVLVQSHYSPLENYDMTQTETPDITKTKHHEENTDMSVSTSDQTTENSLYGYNNASPQPVNKADSSGTTTTTGDVTKNYYDDTDTETGTCGLTRHGNIGVTTSQQMLLSEVDLRDKINFYNIIMNDMDSILCQLVY